ncbi:hybrid sensor histidine kinase/response regulator [Rugamonas apoptosis]|uniref:histidine kinase n=1 Tax=Rugamonas apoptosis TaxID=2758570 RepID=A0A7W2ILM7_9BURK|nr:response regulator [Rugamonas apoptosis]MBA5688637.1 response regulator [Rugamonas apoptosis]
MANSVTPAYLPQERSSKGDILVVEDTPASLQLLTGLLSEAGYRVRPAPDGELALWSARGQAPELILLDIRMPGMDGYEVCRLLKDDARLRDVPVIFLSAFTDTDDKLRGFAVGGVDFISKPYQFEEVHARVQAHLEIARLRQRLAYQNEHLEQLVEAKAAELAQARLSLLSERQLRDLAERESRLRLSEIAHMNRNASATVYCAALVHELNQPLAAIMSNAEAAELFLKMERPALPEVAEILADIRRDDLRASELIQSMRALLKKSEAVTASLDLNEVVRVAALLLASEARVRQCALTLALDVPTLTVAADRIQLQQVMINLILNGMDAMAERPAGARRMVISAGAVDGAAQVLVRDHGSGFQCELGRVFESFFTTKPAGMGLGLSIAAAIVREHGGRIWADNCADGGAVVGFQLPLEVLAAEGAP